MSIDLDRFRLTKTDLLMWEYREKRRLEKMTLKERFAYYEAQEADAMREALAEDSWGNA